MTIKNGNNKTEWQPSLWCRACGLTYHRYMGGLRECCGRCSEGIRVLEEALRKEEASASLSTRSKGTHSCDGV